MKELTNQEKGLICRALIKSNPQIIEIIGKSDGKRGLWQPFVDALAEVLSARAVIISFLFIIISINARAQESKDFQKLHATVVYLPSNRHDTMPAAPKSVISTLNDLSDSNQVNSLTKTIDSLRVQLFVAKYKIERIQYYLKIVNKNPAQMKYLKGWINETLR